MDRGYNDDVQRGSMENDDNGATTTRRRQRDSPDYRGHDSRPRYFDPEQDEGRHRGSYDDRDGGRERGGYRQPYGQGGRNDFFEERRLQRLQSTVTIWPSSPKYAYAEVDDNDHRHGKSDKKTSSKTKHRSSKSRRRSRIPKSDHGASSDNDRRKHKSSKHHSSSSKHTKERRRRDRSPSRDRKRRRSSSPVVVDNDVVTPPQLAVTKVTSVASQPPVVTFEQVSLESDHHESDDELGPMPYNPMTGKAMDPKEFGKALRPGEGSAMAAFVEAGERIPRRGEIGLVSTEIEKYEQAGFVMSGSRHRRMNAVRIRKENQVISAEEKRGILKMQKDEKSKRESQIVASFRELVDTKLQQAQNASRPR